MDAHIRGIQLVRHFVSYHFPLLLNTVIDIQLHLNAMP